jgi:hypothetical protein
MSRVELPTAETTRGRREIGTIELIVTGDIDSDATTAAPTVMAPKRRTGKEPHPEANDRGTPSKRWQQPLRGLRRLVAKATLRSGPEEPGLYGARWCAFGRRATPGGISYQWPALRHRTPVAGPSGLGVGFDLDLGVFGLLSLAMMCFMPIDSLRLAA